MIFFDMLCAIRRKRVTLHRFYEYIDTGNISRVMAN